MIQLQAGYDLGVDPAATQAAVRAAMQPGAAPFSAPAFLSANPTFLTVIDAASIGNARTSFLAAIASAKVAVASLRAEVDDQTNDFIKQTVQDCSFNYTTYVYSCTTAYNVPADLDAFVQGLDQAALMIGASGPVQVAAGQEVSPAVFFAGIDFRATLPTEWNKGVNGNLPGFFPDPTFGGFFIPAPAAVNADANGDGSPDWLLDVSLPSLGKL
jgi:hypothetical protein